MDINAFDLAIGAVVLPPLISVINQRHWSAQMRGILALLVCAGYSLIILLVRGTLDLRDWRDVLLQTAGAAFIAYQTWWHPSGIAPAIEAATSTGPARTGPPATAG